MNTWIPLVLTLGGGLLLLWLVLLSSLYLTSRNRQDALRRGEALRLLPDVIRLLHRLTRDQSLPGGVRLRVGALLIYLALPVDLVPDFIPVIGYADDLLIVALTLRSVIRAAGPAALHVHWPGTTEGLRALELLAGVHRPDPR